MFFTAKESGSLVWLKAALGEQRNTVATLLRRLTGFSASCGMKPSVLGRFLRTLQQVAVEKEIETEIVSRIQAMENHHVHQRGCRKLRSAAPTPKTRKNSMPEVAPEPVERSPSSDNWLVFTAIVALFSRRGPKLDE